MDTMFIKYFFIIITSFFLFYKIQNNIFTRILLIKIIFFTTTSSLICSLVFPPNFSYRTLCLFIVYLLNILLLTNSTFYNTFKISLISYAISFLIHSISTLLYCLIFMPLLPKSVNLLSMPHLLICGTLQFFVSYLLFKIKRLQNGMSFLCDSRLIDCSFIVSLLFILYNTYLKSKTLQSTPLHILAFIFLFFLAIALLIWWRYKITQSYVEKLRVDEVELLYKEISDKDLEIEKLQANNEHLARIIHKDNKLIPAMELAVRNYLQTAFLMKPEDAKQMGVELLSKLERMSEERTGILHTYQEKHSYHQRSGLTSIDAIVDYMENRARTLGMEYQYQFDKTIKDMLPAFITEDDAMHLLSDVIDNAIIAVTYSEKKNIFIHIGIMRGILFMDISDSGIPFSPETYQKFGTVKHTTHAEHGGSGIGLMDIANFKKQYKFSLQIYEYPETEPTYTKKLRILFDRKNHYLIQSFRAKELRSMVIRNDLHILPYTENEKSINTFEEKSKR